MNIQALTPEDFLRIPIKRKWWLLVSIAVCVVLGYVAWKYSPKSFRSTVILTIDSPRIAKEYVKGLSQEGKPYDDPSIVMMQQISLGLTNKSILMPILDTLNPYSDAEKASAAQLMKRLRKGVTVAKPKDGIGVAVSYVNSDPVMAQAVTALLAVKLQEDTLKRREGLVETTTDFLSAELERVKGDLETKERAISDFKRTHMGELPQQMDANLRTLDRLQINLTNSTESVNKLGERLIALERAIKEFSELGPAGSSSLDRDRRVGGTRPIDLRAAKLRESRQKLNELSAIYKENYPDILYLKQEIARLESGASSDAEQVGADEPAGVKNEENGTASRKPIDPYLRELVKERTEVKSEMAYQREKQAQTSRQIKEIEAHVEHTPTREQSLTVLLRDYDNMQKVYQSLLDKRTNARILGNYESQQLGEQYRIIEPASFPDGPEPPTRVHFLLGSVFLGCLIGLGAAIGVEFMKTGFRRPEEVESYLGLPVIASIPAFSSAMIGIGATQSRALLAGPGMPMSPSVSLPSYLGYREGVDGLGKGKARADAVLSLPPKFHLIAKWGPASLMAEQYRVAATRMILMTAEKKNVVILVTSSVMSEGKTTTAVNLAYILAHDLGKSTVLIDCDFKRPMVHEYMGIPAGPGVGDVLQGGEILENCLTRCEGVPLWVLPSGSPRSRPVGLSGIQYVKQILPDLKARYDYIILDGPPVMPLADVNILGGMADMTAFVVRAGGTSQDIAKKALKTFVEMSDAAGIILTQVEMEYAPYFMYAAAYTNEDSGSRS